MIFETLKKRKKRQKGIQGICIFEKQIHKGSYKGLCSLSVLH
jgi:hypothetical protein